MRKSGLSALFPLWKFHKGKQLVSDDTALIRFTIDFFQSVLDEIDLFKSSLKYTEEFENRTFAAVPSTRTRDYARKPTARRTQNIGLTSREIRA